MDRARWGICLGRARPVAGETGPVGTFVAEASMAAPDGPPGRARPPTAIPLRRVSRPADGVGTAPRLAPDEVVHPTGIEVPTDGGRAV